MLAALMLAAVLLRTGMVPIEPLRASAPARPLHGPCTERLEGERAHERTAATQSSAADEQLVGGHAQPRLGPISGRQRELDERVHPWPAQPAAAQQRPSLLGGGRIDGQPMHAARIMCQRHARGAIGGVYRVVSAARNLGGECYAHAPRQRYRDPAAGPSGACGPSGAAVDEEYNGALCSRTRERRRDGARQLVYWGVCSGCACAATFELTEAIQQLPEQRRDVAVRRHRDYLTIRRQQRQPACDAR